MDQCRARLDELVFPVRRYLLGLIAASLVLPQVDVLVFRFNSLDCGCFKQAADSDHHPLRKHQNPLSDFAIVQF